MDTSTSSPDGPRRGRPPSARKREAVLEAATEVFLREGYAGTGMDAVAAEAGVAKQTVYSHFGDKDALFRAVVLAARSGGDARGGGRVPSLDLAAAPDLRAALVAFGSAFLAVTMDPRVAALRRLVIAEAARRPDLRVAWNADGPVELTARLTEEFTELDRTGRLEVPDPARAAGQLIALLSHEANMRSLHGVHALGDDDRRDVAEQAADMIVRAYRALGTG